MLNMESLDNQDIQSIEVGRNYEVFKALEPELIREKKGQYVLMHEGQVIEFYQESIEAHSEGWRLFPDGIFSFHEIGRKKTHGGKAIGILNLSSP